jgi:hypothetical protein
MRAKHVRRVAPGIVLCGLLAGCVLPYPHTTLRSGEIHGTVLDARTHAPVEGAEVVLTDNPADLRASSKVCCTTDAMGHFRHKATHNFHLAVIGLGESQDWPKSHECDRGRVFHANYMMQKFEGWGEVNIELQPKP